MKSLKLVILLSLTVAEIVAWGQTGGTHQMDPVQSTGVSSKDSAIIVEYVTTHHGWPRDQYRIQQMSREDGYIVYWIIYLEEEKKADHDKTKPIEVGRGKSFSLEYDPIRHKVLRELAFQ